METKIVNGVEMRTITAQEGNWLTDGKSFCKRVVLGKDRSPDEWKEISQEEYEKQTAVEAE